MDKSIHPSFNPKQETSVGKAVKVIEGVTTTKTVSFKLTQPFMSVTDP